VPNSRQRKLKARVISSIGASEPNALASELVLERVPFVFKNDWKQYREWKRVLGEALDIDPCDIFITGSGAVGLSLSPYKNFSFFNDTSDIDVAIISPHHFDVAWRHMRTLRRTGLSYFEWESVKAHQQNYIYWGCVATDKILHLLPFGREWLGALVRMEGIDPASGRSISARIYRDARSLRDYTAFTLRALKANLADAA
jgi:hypothetical protein